MQTRHPACSHARAGLVLRRSRGTAELRERVRCQAAQPLSFLKDELAQSVAKNLHAFYKFTRPHTILGTVLSVASVSLLALQGEVVSVQAVGALAAAQLAAFLANISIVGLNQCYDVEIDKVNKPYLPLASGEWSIQTGWNVVIASGALSLLTAWSTQSWPLIGTVALSLVLGVVYSADLPFLRWKRSPLAAAACILAVRAGLVQMGFWAHMRLAVTSGPLVPTPELWFMTAFMFFFSIVIALFKDIPDVRGDELHGTRTASVRFGTKRIFWTSVGLLHFAYAMAAIFFAVTCKGWVRLIAVASQVLMATALQTTAAATRITKHADLVDCYMFVWKLFYSQYFVFPLLILC